jgi:hypothetical protein
MNTPDRAQSLAALVPRGTLVEVPGASGYVHISRRPSALPSGETLCDPRACEALPPQTAPRCLRRDRHG